MEKTTRKLNDLLSQFLSLRNEVSEIADKTADAVFDSVESGDITKEEELTKCFKCNSSLTLGWLSELTDLRDYIFKNTNLWLKPTSEK